MRIWSIHPSQLDKIGLVALWRETLLAQKVLHGETKGYKFHPQLTRFKEAPDPKQAVADYLWAVVDESINRGYSFDRSKIRCLRSQTVMVVTDGQLKYEFEHLLRKLEVRDPERYKELNQFAPLPHPMFRVEPGPIADWEIR